MEARPTAQPNYQTTTPTTAELMDALRESAVVLSDTIKALNERGISVSIQSAPAESERLIQLVFTC